MAFSDRSLKNYKDRKLNRKLSLSEFQDIVLKRYSPSDIRELRRHIYDSVFLDMNIPQAYIITYVLSEHLEDRGPNAHIVDDTYHILDPLEDLPLYINDPDPVGKAVVTWRLMIGK